MDPNATLEEIRRLVRWLNAAPDDNFKIAEWREKAESLVLHVSAMDGWLSKGGFLPEPWDHAVQVCKFCNTEELGDAPHMHQGRPVCDDCWDDRLLSTS